LLEGLEKSKEVRPVEQCEWSPAGRVVRADHSLIGKVDNLLLLVDTDESSDCAGRLLLLAFERTNAWGCQAFSRPPPLPARIELGGGDEARDEDEAESCRKRSAH
jgi:hypothetical protein